MFLIYDEVYEDNDSYLTNKLIGERSIAIASTEEKAKKFIEKLKSLRTEVDNIYDNNGLLNPINVKEEDYYNKLKVKNQEIITILNNLYNSSKFNNAYNSFIYCENLKYKEIRVYEI